MRLNYVNSPDRGMSITSTFKGLNHTLYSGDGFFYDMKNMTPDHFPILSPREKRVTVKTITTPNGLLAKDQLVWVDGTSLYYGGTAVSGLVLSNGAKQLVSMGAMILIFPDNKYYNTMTSEYGSLDASFTSTNGQTVNYYPCTKDGTTMQNATSSATPPSNPQNGDYWYDTENKSLKQYSSYTEQWNTVTETFIKIAYTGIGAGFNYDDSVSIAGSVVPDCNATMILFGKDDNYLIVSGLIAEHTSQTTPLSVQRLVPVMDFVCESNNRIWGCRFGRNRANQFVNEIYACRLGDPTNWESFQGTDMDSYYLNLGSDGYFTGCANYGGTVTFFKESVIHRLMGDLPSNYTLNDIHARGVQRGSEKSLVMINEVLYYKAKDGIMAYDGSMPTKVSDAIGSEHYRNATAGWLGNKYYICMKNTLNTWDNYTYDTANGIWSKEDATQFSTFVNYASNLYAIDNAGHLLVLNGEHITPDAYTAVGMTTEGNFTWFAETGDLLIDNPYQKFLTKIILRVALAKGSKINVSAKFGYYGEWKFLSSHESRGQNSFSIPIYAPRCDYAKVRIEGYGDAKVFSIAMETETASDTVEKG